MNIKDFPEKLILNGSDYILIQDSLDSAYKYTLVDTLRSTSSTGASGSKLWKKVNTNYSVILGDRIFADTSQQQITLSMPAGVPGAEVEVLRLDAANYLKLSNVSKLNGKVITSSTKIRLNKLSETSTKLVFVDDATGWICIPILGVIIQSSLNLPALGLKQLFNAVDIQSPGEGVKLATWVDTQSGLNATQPTALNQSTYYSDIFSGLPGLLFSGQQFYLTDISYIAASYYTVAVVERRSSSTANHIFGQDNATANQALHIGYRNNTAFTLAQYANDLDCSVPIYAAPTNRIWVGSFSSRGYEIWLNNSLVASNANNQGLTVGTNGRIGRVTNSSYYYGHVGLVAVYNTNKSQQDIRDVFTAINDTFAVY